MRAAKVDSNQRELVANLRKAGCSVFIVSQLKGFCDIVVGKNGRNYLFEIKDPAKPPSHRKLTPKEKEFQATWKGQVDTVLTVEEILHLVES